MVKITGHEGVARQAKSGCRPPQTRNNKQGEGGNGVAGGTILRCSDPKSNGESKNKHWLTPVPLNRHVKSLNNRTTNLNANLDFSELLMQVARPLTSVSWKKIGQFYSIYISNGCIWPILTCLNFLLGPQEHNSEVGWQSTISSLPIHAFLHSFIQHNRSC